MSTNTEAIPQDAKPSLAERKKHTATVLWTSETKINLYQSDGKAKVGEERILMMIQTTQAHLCGV